MAWMVGALRLALPAGSAAQYANLLYPLPLTVLEKPAIAVLVKSVGPEILHKQEQQTPTS